MVHAHQILVISKNKLKIIFLCLLISDIINNIAKMSCYVTNILKPLFLCTSLQMVHTL